MIYLFRGITFILLFLVCIGCSANSPGSPPHASQLSIRDEAVQAGIEKLYIDNIESYIEASDELSRLGVRAVPALEKLLWDRNADAALGAVFVLDRIADPSAVPCLMKVVDLSPEATLTKDTYNGMTPAGRALYAREAVVHILNPASRSWESAELGAPPDAPSFANRQAYQLRIKQWYNRVQKGEPSPTEERPCDL